MRKVFINSFVFFILTIFISLSCSKKSSSSSTQITAANLQGSYKITDMKVSVNNQQADVFSQLSSCQKNDIYYLGANGIYSLGGSSDQSCTDPDDSGTWALSGNTLTITGQSGTQSFNVSSFSNNNLIVTYVSTYNSASANYTTTFTKQ